MKSNKKMLIKIEIFLNFPVKLLRNFTRTYVRKGRRPQAGDRHVTLGPALPAKAGGWAPPKPA